MGVVLAAEATTQGAKGPARFIIQAPLNNEYVQQFFRKPEKIPAGMVYWRF
jgi:hypothetical protein